MNEEQIKQMAYEEAKSNPSLMSQYMATYGTTPNNVAQTAQSQQSAGYSTTNAAGERQAKAGYSTTNAAGERQAKAGIPDTRQAEAQADAEAYRASHPENVAGTTEHNGKVTRQAEAQADAEAYRASHPENVAGTPEHNNKVARDASTKVGEEYAQKAQSDMERGRAAQQEAGPRTATVATQNDNLNVRAGAGTDSEKIGSLAKGSTVEVLGEKTVDGKKWTHVKMEDGSEGYVASDYLKANPRTTTSTAGNSTQAPDSYTVQSGDTLSSIVRGINSKAGANVMSVEALAILNGIPDPDKINAGQELTLTADKEAVDSCISSLTSWINNMNSIQSSIQSALDKADTNLSAVNTNFDNKISGLKSMMSGNFTNILADAEAFKSWMQELSSALEEETSYADTTIGNFASNPITHL